MQYIFAKTQNNKYEFIRKTTNKVMTKNLINNTSLRIMPKLKELAVYKTVEFPISKLTVVNATIQKVKMETDKVFTYRSDRTKKIIEVTRIK